MWWNTVQQLTGAVSVSLKSTDVKVQISPIINQHHFGSSMEETPHLRMMDEEGDGPLEDGGGGLHAGSEDVSHSHEDVVVAEAHRLCARRRRVVVLGAALGPQQRIQQVSLHVVTVVGLVGDGIALFSS